MPTKIAISAIDIPTGRRRLDPAWVETVADLFSSQGQLSPIEVLADGPRFRLVFGHHRLAAAKLLGWAEVEAVVKDALAFTDAAEIRLREITENLARRELSVLDRAVDIASWREIYEATHLLNTKGGRPRKIDPEETSLKFETSFSDAARKVLDISRPTLFRALKIATIPASVRDEISLRPIADNQSDLLLLAAVDDVGRQAAIGVLIGSQKATTFAEAIAILDQAPKPTAPPKWEKVAGAFSLLKESEQDRFFVLHEAAIQRWMKGRQS
ncbi:ParB N-terminal domain-containing protein [Mesorhizobium amorphae]|uniref:ParB/RepB/Spo0J family partition protein n=1 Tax=Mesorhizobium amorphae TaxID=71433 RepID=UPI003ECDD048